VVEAFCLEDRLALIKWHRILNISIRTLVIIALLVPLCFILPYISIFTQRDVSHDISKQPRLYKTPQEISSKEYIENWNGKVTSEDLWIPLPKIEEQLVFFEYNDRPDCINGEKGIFLGLKGSEDKKIVGVGDKIYLECMDLEDVRFSETKTPFQVEFSLLKNGALEAVFQTQLLGEEETIAYKKLNKFQLQKVDKAPRNLKDQNSLAAVIDNLKEKVRVLPPDRLIELYGGERFRSEKGLYRFEILDDSTKVYYIHEGDYLVWSDNSWQKGSEQTKGKPLLLIKTLNMQSCEYQLWDEKGFISEKGVLQISGSFPSFTKTYDTFANLNYRTESSVTCKLEKKNVILRKGDWLIKSKKGWKSIQCLRELENFLSYALKAELFIFDGIIEKEGSKVFKGHLFDPDRTVAQAVEMTLKEKKIRKKPKKPVNLVSTPSIKKSARKKK